MKLHGFSKKELLDIYYKMTLSRCLDNKQLILLKQGKGYFHIGASGHEAAQMAAAMNFKPGFDYAYPYYRNQAFAIGWGITAKEHLLSFLAKEDDPNSGGRQMPQHFGHKDLHVVTQGSSTGTQFLQAVGAAFGMQRDNEKGVVYVSSGEGTTSQGDFHEALNWASKDKAPVIFHIEDNNFAISVPKNEQTSGESIYDIAQGYDSLMRYDVDGTNFFETYVAFNKAVERARASRGPSIIVSNVVRLLPHSNADDHRKYRTEKEIENDKKRDPLIIFSKKCILKGIINKEEFEELDAKALDQVNSETNWADQQSDPDPDDVMKNMYIDDDPINNYTSIEPNSVGDKVVLVDAINHALDEELSYNKKMMVYGEDVGGGKGGVFTATRGLTDKHGVDRVYNSPLAESSIVGTAIGLSTVGYKPVVEIQFGDYIWTSMMQIRNELSTIRYRSNGDWSCPIVIRVPVGGYIHGALCHSQSIDGYFAHLPGIKIAYPSNAADAKGLLKTACRMNDPVIFMEHKGLYRQGFAARPEPDSDFLLEFGKANIVQEGNDLTIVTWGSQVQKSIESVRNTETSVEIIDIRTINPLDLDTILQSVKKTSRVLIVHEDNMTNGFGAEIAAKISDVGFEYLDAPIKRVASLDCHVAYAPVLENEILVQTSWIEDAIKELLEY
ncbi:MAG: tungsten formylmethanofuran dehydrogenase [Candidatus Marinimicrobia bacterium]|nr:tungsten formylmethanofuran dehydrogenase [Candidatus Neomarinimicrobiota bacterium]MAR30345.1 tungsten formylmethanofuran dehydrogenase [Candidatus Neomarinimicrobiota bacterium]